jgi:ornithine cyclodeaminase/alanine dehydrogenase-like protein (mu-crystallin family)
MYGKLREHKYTGRPGKYGGLILLFSSETGELLAILNDGLLQHMRVGATYGLGTKYQARSDAAVMGLLGTGAMARVYAASVAMVRPIQRIKVYSPNEEHRLAYAQEMTEKLGIEVQPVGSVEAAVTNVDVLASMTDSMEPTLTADMLHPGMHVTTVTAWEIDKLAFKRIDRMVNQRDGISDHHYTTPPDWRPSRVGGSYEVDAQAEATVPRDRVHTLPEVMQGQAPGRANDEEVTFFQSEGTGLQFAAVSKMVYERARERGLGRELPAEWFLQDIRT